MISALNDINAQNSTSYTIDNIDSYVKLITNNIVNHQSTSAQNLNSTINTVCNNLSNNNFQLGNINIATSTDNIQSYKASNSILVAVICNTFDPKASSGTNVINKYTNMNFNINNILKKTTLRSI